MAEIKAGQSTEDPTLQEVYDQAMKLFDTVNNGKEATNSDSVQVCFSLFYFILCTAILRS